MLTFFGILFVFVLGYIAGGFHGVYNTRKKLISSCLAAGNKLLNRQAQIREMKPEDAAFYALKVAEKELEVTGEHPTPTPKNKVPKT